jgi:hypothetical protein
MLALLTWVDMCAVAPGVGTEWKARLLGTAVEKTRAVLLLFFTLGWLHAQEAIRQEIFTNFAPAEVLKPAIQDALSPEGRFVILPEKGTVLVIDQPARITAAREAIQVLKAPEPVLELHVGVRTGGILPVPPAPVADPSAGGRDFLVPPPRVITLPNGNYVIVPATPTRFGRRSVGTSLESTAIANADGSVHVNLTYQDVEFAGFIPYGSPVLPFGSASAVPMQARLPRPLVMGVFLRSRVPELPVSETTRISTSILVYPQRTAATVQLELLPQVTVIGEHGAQDRPHAFLEYKTKLVLKNGEVVTLRGFRNAPDTFNEAFFGDEEHSTGETELVLKVRIAPDAGS